jgi:hypothetical protein
MVGIVIGMGLVYAAQKASDLFYSAGRFMCDAGPHASGVPCSRCVPVEDPSVFSLGRLRVSLN